MHTMSRNMHVFLFSIVFYCNHLRLPMCLNKETWWWWWWCIMCCVTLTML